jgi:hypothetical protein
MNPPRQGIVIDRLWFLSGWRQPSNTQARTTVGQEMLVSRHLKTADDLFDSKPSPRTESMLAAAVQWAERIMLSIDNVFPK